MYLGKQNYRMVNMSQQLPHNYISTVNPTIDVNPPILNMTWLNSTSGEVFVCTDNTIDSNIWESDNTRISLPYIDGLIFEQKGLVGNFVRDISGNENNAPITGACTTILDNIGEDALKINGTGQYADTGITSIGHEATYFCKFKLFSYPSVDWVNIIDKGDYDGSFCISMRDGVGTQGLRSVVIDNSSTDVTIYSDTNPTLNDWHNVAITISLTEHKLYFDGSLIGKNLAVSGGLKLDSTSITLGLTSVGTSRYMDGAISQTRIFNRVVSDTELSYLFKESAL